MTPLQPAEAASARLDARDLCALRRIYGAVMTVRWLTAFIDRPADTFDAAVAFWSQVTCSTVSSTRGDRDEFVTLLPAAGDPYLRIQRVDDGPGGSHLDVHAPDIGAMAGRANELGASTLDELDDVTALASPAGARFCVVEHGGESVRPEPVRLDGGPRTLVDQLCIDIPPELHDTERDFWQELLGWPLRAAARLEYTFFERPRGMPLRILLQREDDDRQGRTARAHLDLACDDVDTVAAQHERLGATIVDRHEWWHVMSDPSGLPYCLIRRSPDTGTLTA